jgi:hypothetical protein
MGQQPANAVGFRQPHGSRLLGGRRSNSAQHLAFYERPTAVAEHLRTLAGALAEHRPPGSAGDALRAAICHGRALLPAGSGLHPARPIADWGRRFGPRYLPRLTEDLRRLPLEGIVPQPPRHGSWYSIRSHSDSHTHSHTWSGTCRRKSSCRYIYRLAIIDAYLIGEVPRAYRCSNGIVAACW